MSGPRDVLLQPSFLLHQRDYRNTSRIVELITQDYGRITGIVRGVRRPKSPLRGLLKQFSPVRVSWLGRGNMVTVTDVEPGVLTSTLTGLGLLCGFYVNELLLRLLASNDPLEELFEDYTDCLSSMSPGMEAKSLRVFEKRLLANLGYGLNLEYDFVAQEPVQSDAHYQYEPDRGPFQVNDGGPYSGASLLSLAREELGDDNSLKDAQSLLRMTLDRHLGGKPLKSREVLRAMRRLIA